MIDDFIHVYIVTKFIQIHEINMITSLFFLSSDFIIICFCARVFYKLASRKPKYDAKNECIDLAQKCDTHSCTCIVHLDAATLGQYSSHRGIKSEHKEMLMDFNWTNQARLKYFHPLLHIRRTIIFDAFNRIFISRVIFRQIVDPNCLQIRLISHTYIEI